MPKKSIAIVSGLMLIAAIFFTGFLKGPPGYVGILIDLIAVSTIWLILMALIYKFLYPIILYPIVLWLMSTLIVITNFHHMLEPVRVLGEYYRWLTSGWRLNLLPLPVIAVVVWLILVIYAPLAVTPINEELLSTSLDNASHALANGSLEINQINKNITTAFEAINSASPEINRAAGHLANTSPALAEINRTLKNLSIEIGKLNNSNSDVLINTNRSLISTSKAIEEINRSINNASQSISGASPKVGKANSSINNASIATAGLAAGKTVPHSAKILNNFTGIVLGATTNETTVSLLLVIYYYLNIILGIWLLLLFIINAIKARNMMVIEEFVDNTGNAAAQDAPKDDSTDDGKPDGSKSNGNKLNNSKSDINKSDDSKSSSQVKVTAKGLNTMLAARLIYLSKIYSDVDENREILTYAGTDSTLPATVQVDEVGDLLKGAITPQSTTKLGGFLEIPTTVLMYPLQLFFKGPRITGSLYNDGGKVLLIAQISGWKQPYSWRVCDPEKIIETQEESNETSRLTENMIAELAYRIFTDLAFDKSISWSKRWRAIWKFSDGLQMYRDCLRTQKDKKLNLKKAEDKFIETLAEDREFSAAYYNLGVVYTELGRAYDESERFEAAESAFRKAIEKNIDKWDNDKWQAYYALGQNLFDRKQSSDIINDVISLSNRVINLGPKKIYMAKALNLMGRAQREACKYSDEQKYLNEAIESHKKASVNALYALMEAIFWDRNDKQYRITTAKCLLDLANAYHDLDSNNMEGINEASCILSEARLISPHNANIHYQLGRIYINLHKGKNSPSYLEHSISQFENAIKLDPSKPIYWSYLALASAYNSDKARLEYARKKLLDDFDNATSKDLEMLIDAYKNSGYDKNPLMDSLNKFLTYKNFWEDPETQKVKSYTSLKNKYLNPWERGEIAIILADKYLNQGINREELPKDIFDEAIQLLEKDIRDTKSFETDVQTLEFAYSLCILNNLFYYDKEINGKDHNLILLDEYTDKNIHRDFPQRYIKIKNDIDDIQSRLEEWWSTVPIREKCIEFDPFSSRNRQLLAISYQYARCYKLARAEHERAYWLEPDDADNLCNLGYTYINEALEQRNFNERDLALKKNISYLNNALALYSTSEQKIPTYYWLGRLYYEARDYDTAILNLLIAKNMTNRDIFQDEILLAIYYLGNAYLKNRMHKDAEQQFKELIFRIMNNLYNPEQSPDDKIKNEKELIKKEIGEKFYERKLKGAIYIDAYLSLAESYITCDNKFLNEPHSHIYRDDQSSLKYEFQKSCATARDCLISAKTIINMLDTSFLTKLDTRDEINEWYNDLLILQAKYNDLAGWCQLKVGLNDESIRHLEASISLLADSRTYLHLAQAYDQEIRDRNFTGLILSPQDKQRKIKRILACCQHAQDLDFNKEYAGQAKNLQEIYQDKGSDKPKDEIMNKKTVKAEITWEEDTKEEKKGA